MLTAERISFLEKRASFFRAVSAVTPIVNEELDDRTKMIVRNELKELGLVPPLPHQNNHPKFQSKSKLASLLPSFYQELDKLANLLPVATKPSTPGSLKATSAKSIRSTIPKYTQVNPSTSGSPAQQNQPLLGPPPVRG